MVSLWRLELGCHVACTVDSSKCQVAFICLEVSCDLTFIEVWSPSFSSVPSKRCDPILCSKSWDCAIGVSRVVKHPILASECFVNPLTTFARNGIVNIVGAKLPRRKISWDMHSSTNISWVQIVIEWAAPCARWEDVSLTRMLQPWSVVIWTVALSWLTLSISQIKLWMWFRTITDTIDIVNVYIGGVALKLWKKTEADGSRMLQVGTSKVTVISFEFIIQLSII